MIGLYNESEIYRIIEKLINTRDDPSNCISGKAKNSITECVNMLNDIIEDAKY